MEPIKIIVFDFDNCIALDEHTGEGSEEIKDRAWFDVFFEYDRETLGEVIAQGKFAIVGGKGDRNDIARHVLEHFKFPAHDLSREVIARCNRFDAIVQGEIGELSITPMVRCILRDLSGRFSIYINTATPKESIIKTLQMLDLEFFKGIYGRPGTKVGNLQEIIVAEGVFANEVLFVGDMQSDYEAAQAGGCQFIGVRTKRNATWHESQPFPVIGSLAELKDIV